MPSVVRTLQLAAYHSRRLDWLVRNRFHNAARFPIDRPIFFLGNQGGGLTFLSRMLRRNRAVVTATGNAEYWTGADEIQRVFQLALPPAIRSGGRFLSGDPPHPHLTPPRGWTYGCNDLIDQYHTTERDASPEEAKVLRRVIGQCLSRYALTDRPRFLDKSQIYTIKTRHIQELLKGTHPHFMLVTRHPISSVHRAAMGRSADIARYTHLTFDQKLTVCSEHWNNCMAAVLDDSQHLEHFAVFRFEDVIRDLETGVREICKFTGLEFDDDMLPRAEHKIPFATRYVERWYPVQTRVLDVKKGIEQRDIDHIREICGKTAERLGYEF